MNANIFILNAIIANYIYKETNLKHIIIKISKNILIVCYKKIENLMIFGEILTFTNRNNDFFPHTHTLKMYIFL
jgi:hypothetical protein